jgi:hypothetical protein
MEVQPHVNKTRRLGPIRAGKTHQTEDERVVAHSLQLFYTHTNTHTHFVAGGRQKPLPSSKRKARIILVDKNVKKKKRKALLRIIFERTHPTAKKKKREAGKFA